MLSPAAHGAPVHRAPALEVVVSDPTLAPDIAAGHVGLSVTDLDRSLAFYKALGYEVVGSVPETPFGRLTMLKLPDDPFVSLELVHDAEKGAVDLGPSQSGGAIPLRGHVEAVRAPRHRERQDVVRSALRPRRETAAAVFRPPGS